MICFRLDSAALTPHNPCSRPRLIFLGVLNGYVTLMGILACEIAGKENQTRILAYVLGSSSLTQLLAPALAG